MSEQLEGAGARIARQQREGLQALMNKCDDKHQMICIVTDLTGATPTHVSIQGPSKDPVLLHGMLGVAGDVVRMVNQPKKENQE